MYYIDPSLVNDRFCIANFLFCQKKKSKEIGQITTISLFFTFAFGKYLVSHDSWMAENGHALKGIPIYILLWLGKKIYDHRFNNTQTIAIYHTDAYSFIIYFVHAYLKGKEKEKKKETIPGWLFDNYYFIYYVSWSPFSIHAFIISFCWI